MNIYNHNIRMILGAVTVLGWLASLSSTFAQTGTWTNAASLPQNTAGAAVAVVNGLLYAVGGATGLCSSSQEVFAYDPAANRWSQKASLNGPLSTLAIASLNGTLYAIGGGNGCTDTGVNSVQAYNPAANVWTSMNHFPEDIRGACAVVANGTLYVIGGELDGNVPTNTAVYSYNPAGDSWALVSALPVARQSFACAVANNLIYVLGGSIYPGSVGSPSDIVWAFNPATGIWSTNAPTPANEANASAPTVGGLIYFTGGVGTLGGTESGGNTNLVQIYNPGMNTWSVGKPLPINLYGASCAALNGKLYVVGGEVYDQQNPGATSFQSAVYVFTPDTLQSIGMYAGLTLQGQVGSSIQINYASSLGGSNWLTLTNFILPDSPYLFIDTSSPAGQQRFYQAVVEP